MYLLKVAPEGLPYIIITAALTLIVYLVGKPWMAVIPFILFIYMEIFFRDPDRVIPKGEDIFVSPADGKVIEIRKTREGEYLQDEVRQISIFMSPLNVHVNRAPCDGSVVQVKHSPGGFSAAYTDEASLKNEHIAMLLDTASGRILVKQIAGFLARRAVCRVKPGDSLKRGDRYGIIKFGSRVDLFLPKEASPLVVTGQKVKAGETVVATLRPLSSAAGDDDWLTIE